LVSEGGKARTALQQAKLDVALDCLEELVN